ncbi:hypothetical protein GH714_029575 [Hevea brasiliensis]|uniref:ELMO domain-containing protein n=1 Tax=Hevea brasiliensis TaxID=3981 RepID=A0A6A6KV91_HEVBR|nr:hypothetical protein GH714_029575 [Hevea brasiliensis]
MASLLYEGGGEEREVVRVLNPERADAFFVPFFSSLSFNTHGRNMTDPETEKDRQLQVDVIEFLSQSKHWQRSGGRDHVIPMTHPNAFRFLRQQLNASILIVADFGRYPKSMSTLWKDVVAPYVHVVDFFTDDEISDPFESRTTLLFFRGGMVRKDEGKVRAELAKILAGYDDVHFEQSTPTPRTIKMSTQGMRSSKFCLHPAGDTPSSCRLFDAIVSHCVPVIVSDQIELPFEDEIDYSQFSIFFSVNEAIQPGYIVDQLRQFSKERWVKMWRQLKNISHHFEFQYPPKKEDAVDMLWRQEERLKRLKHRMKVYFDASRSDHQEALRALWSATYPDRELHGLISDQWKEMGWQGRDPSTDFRGAGFISLENLLFFAKTYSTSFQHLLKKQEGKRSAWEYPFAVAGINITFMIMQMLDLDASKPRTFVTSVFLHMLSENEWAFDLLYCMAFVVMDKQWLGRNATYMEFNDVLKSTRAHVESELLMDDVLRIEDMPSYALLS